MVTDKALFDFGNAEREMQLVSLHPGVTLDEVRDSMGWKVRLAEDIAETPVPTDEELRVVREELDPEGLYR